MKKSFYTVVYTAVLALMLAPAASGQTIPGPDTEVLTEKRGQTGFKFLTVAVDPRTSALGGAITASTIGTSTALFYNPASMAFLESSFHASFGTLQYITDINYNAASLAFRPSNGRYGVFGLSFVSVDYGDFFETIRANNEDGFLEMGMYNPTAMAVGLGYARMLSDRFSVGGQIKYALQDLGSFPFAREATGTAALTDGTNATYKDYNLNTLAYDLGVLYHTGFRSLTLAMSTRNFSQELQYERERFELPLVFQLGVSMDVINLTSMDPEMHSLLLAVDAQRPRDFSEHLKVGAEYTFYQLLSLRAGYSNAFVSEGATEEGLSLGAGLQYQIGTLGFGADYSYTNFGLFGNVSRIGIQLSF